MRNLFTKRISVLATALIIYSSTAISQVDVDFLKSAPSDGVKYLQAYVSPWVNAFGAGLNGSWYNTAKPHKLGGFDITLGANVGIVPSSAETFNISDQSFSSSLSFSGANAPTIAGPKNPSQPVTGTYSIGAIPAANFPTPPGTNWKYIPVPTLQVGIGLPLGTELKGRFIPKLNFRGGDLMLWGVGLMHSLTQYLPGDKIIPIDVSLFGGYTNLSGHIPLNLQPDPAMSNYTTIDPDTYFADQNMEAKIQALNASLVGSVNLKIITFYGGLGYSNTQTTCKLIGNFPSPVLNNSVPEYNDTPASTVTGDEFPEINIKNFSGLRANVGFRIKLAVITIHADYTRSQYNVVSAGLGVSFR